MLTNNYNSKQSSCYFLDIRNSTNIIRTISLDKDKTLNNTEARINAHSEFMLDIHIFLRKKLEELGITDFYFSNTGDGHTCLLWNKTHAWTILHLACAMSTFLETRIDQYKTNYLDVWSKAYGTKNMSIGFGIGMHTGGSVINHQTVVNNNFAYGVVLNSAARTEAFTKNFPTIPLLFTGNLKDFLKRQYPLLTAPKKPSWIDYEPLISAVTNFPVDIKDSKSSGHRLYTITKPNRSFFLTT
jgi:hypothetical protein